MWAQIELYLAMKRALKGKGALKREETGIWPHSMDDRVDFWFDWGDAANPNKSPYRHWGIELKCRTVAQTHDKFMQKMFEDFDKCNKTPTETPTLLYAVGISPDPYDCTGYPEKWGLQGTPCYSKISNPAKKLPDIYLVWRRLEHKPPPTGISFTQNSNFNG